MMQVTFQKDGTAEARLVSAANDAALKVAYLIAEDAVHEPPRPPIERGILRGSVTVEREPNGGASVSFRTPYALRLHESPDASNWPSRGIDPDVGPKYLQLKLFSFGDKYNRAAAKFMGAAL